MYIPLLQCIVGVAVCLLFRAVGTPNVCFGYPLVCTIKHALHDCGLHRATEGPALYLMVVVGSSPCWIPTCKLKRLYTSRDTPRQGIYLVCGASVYDIRVNCLNF